MTKNQFIRMKETNQFIRMKELVNITGLPRPTIYLLVERGEFPLPVTLSDSKRAGRRAMIGWVGSEIDKWMERRIAVREAGGAKIPAKVHPVTPVEQTA